jgi:hypothetical protein
MEALVATLSNMNSLNAHHKNTIPLETQWQNSKGKAPGRVKTLPDLANCAMQVIKNVQSRMTNTIFHAGWEAEEANLFHQAGLLPANLVLQLTSMDHYWELFSHL